MAQAQVDLSKEVYGCDFDHLHTDLFKKQIECLIDETTKVVVKKRGKHTRIQLVVKGKKILITKENWTKLCYLKDSILFLHSFIDEH